MYKINKNHSQFEIMSLFFYGKHHLTINQVYQIYGKGIITTSCSLSFGFSRLGIATVDNLHFFNMVFVLWSDALPAINPLFGGENWGTCLPHKGGGFQFGAVPKDITSEFAGLFSTTTTTCQAPSRKAVNIIF